jgi:hypothetical protein
LRRLFVLCGLLFIGIYATEAPIRYGLNAISADNMIFVRDFLLVVPLAALFVLQAFNYRIHPAYWAFLAIVLLHGSISYFNFHTEVAAVYGAKFLIPLLFGFFLAGTFTEPKGKTIAVIAILWLVTVIALGVDKFGPNDLFPWAGMKTTIGDLKVDISNNWDITSGLDRRVAGLTRSSIDAAMLLPMLALVIAPRCRWVLRLIVLAASETAIYFTTQKGALIVFGCVSAALILPRYMWYKALNALCIVFAATAVIVPIATQGLLASTAGDNFSLASFGMRIQTTWPDAFRWISDNSVFPFGVGLGGIGGGQRLFAQDLVNAADNVFLFMYGNFGILALFYLGWAASAGLLLPRYQRDRSHVPLAIMAQNLGYGIVLSMMEGQIAMLFTGAALGTLWLLRKEARVSIWGDNFRDERFAVILGPPPRDALPGNRPV